MALRPDLHLHSTCSDGALAPAELVRLAARHGVDVLALTDHDTVDGLREAEAEARAQRLTLIPALELSVYEGGQDLHLLAYHIDPADVRLCEELRLLRGARERRLDEMLIRLARLGLPLKRREVEAEVAPGAPVGRMHVAAALVRRRWAGSRDEAFRLWLGDGRPAHVKKETLRLEESLEILLGAGGVPVLAHPATYDLSGIWERLVRAGLMGIEVMHPSHTAADQARYRDLARSSGLCQTGGSDYHGNRNGEVPVGGLPVDPACVSELETARSRVTETLRRTHA